MAVGVAAGLTLVSRVMPWTPSVATTRVANKPAAEVIFAAPDPGARKQRSAPQGGPVLDDQHTGRRIGGR